MEFELTGMGQILASIESMGKKGSASLNAALKKGGELLVEEMKRRAPKSIAIRKKAAKPGIYRKGSLKGRRRSEISDSWRTGVHGYKLISASGVRTGANGKFVAVGVQSNDNSTAFYLKFHEYGSSSQAAKPFVAPAYESKIDEVKEAMKTELITGLGLS